MLNQDIKKVPTQKFLLSDDNHEAIGDYALEPELFLYRHGEKTKMFISKLIILLEDNAQFKSNRYGAECVLKNGIKIYSIKNGIKNYLVGDLEPIKKNKDWLQYSCKVEQEKFADRETFLRITFDFKKDMSYIVLEKGDSFVVELNDDFSTLENHTFHINGFNIKI